MHGIHTWKKIKVKIAIEAGELTQESWPYESFSKPYRKTKDGPKYIKMNWASTEEPLTAISHLPAEEIKKKLGWRLSKLHRWRDIRFIKRKNKLKSNHRRKFEETRKISNLIKI